MPGDMKRACFDEKSNPAEIVKTPAWFGKKYLTKYLIRDVSFIISPMLKSPRFGFAVFFAAALTGTLCAGLPARAADGGDPYVFLLDGEGLFGYSDTDGSTGGDFSTSDKWLSSLALKLNGNDQLIGLYNGSFQQSDLFIRQEEGSQSSNQVMDNNFSFAFKKFVDSRTVFKPSFFYDIVYVKDSADEELGNGLYDYTDLGGGFENTHLFGEGADGSKLTYGFNYFRREYPNYRSLSALASRNPLEDREKDFDGYKLDAAYRAPWWFKTTGELSAQALLKNYVDKRTVDANGIFKDDNRQDTYLEAGGTLIKQVTKEMSVSLVTQWKGNYSNLDFYDTRNSLALTDDRFFENYYDYWAYVLAPGVSIRGPKIFQNASAPSSVRVGYTYEKTHYPGRVAQNTAGTLSDEDQEDLNHKVAAQLSVPLDQHWTWLLAGSYEKQTSNQAFEQTFRYTYETWSVLSGVRFEL